MFSYEFYKNLHLLGIFMLFLSLGGLVAHRINGGQRQSPWRRSIALTHGFGMTFVLIAGFGMMARLGVSWPYPGWIWLKFSIWLFFGGSMAFAYRMPATLKALWFTLLGLGGVAAFLAIYKPF